MQSKNLKLDLSIVIVSFNTKELLADCIDSILENTKGMKLPQADAWGIFSPRFVGSGIPPKRKTLRSDLRADAHSISRRGIKFEVIIVDNASKDGSVEVIKSYVAKTTRVKAIYNRENTGFAAANNRGYKISLGRYILFLNSDTSVSDNVLGAMVSWMDENAEVGIASCALKNKDGSLQGTGGYFPTLIRVFSWMTIQDIPFVDSLIAPFHPVHRKSFLGSGVEFYERERELDWLTGAFLLIRREALDEISGWSEDYFMYMEEVDLCFRIKKNGWKVIYNPSWSIVHLGGASSTDEFPLLSEYKGVKIFYKKHFPAWQYPLVRLLLKIGALGRIVLFGILEGRKGAEIYAKAYEQA